MSTFNTIGNLRLDGYEEIARRIRRKYHRQGLRVMVVVDDAGRAFTRLAATRGLDPLPAHLVGTYDPDVPEEVVENDLLARLQELNKEPA